MKIKATITDIPEGEICGTECRFNMETRDYCVLFEKRLKLKKNNYHEAMKCCQCKKAEVGK